MSLKIGTTFRILEKKDCIALFPEPDPGADHRILARTIDRFKFRSFAYPCSLNFQIAIPKEIRQGSSRMSIWSLMVSIGKRIST